MEKGFNLQIEEFKNNLGKVVNESNMPISLIEMALSGLLQEVHIVKVQQLEREKQEYEKSLQEAESKPQK